MLRTWVSRPACSTRGRDGPGSTSCQGSGSPSCGQLSLKIFSTITSTFWHPFQHHPPQHQSIPYLPIYVPRRSSISGFHYWISKHSPRPGPVAVGPGLPISPGSSTGDQARTPPDIATLAALQRGRARITTTSKALEGSETVAPTSDNPQEASHGLQVERNPHTPFELAYSASTGFLNFSESSLNSNKGRCQDPSAHGRLFIIIVKSTLHRCDICEKPGKKDNPRGSHKLGGFPCERPPSRAADWRQSSSLSRPLGHPSKHHRVAISEARFTSTDRYLRRQQQHQPPLRQLVPFLPNRQTPLRTRLPCLHTWPPRATSLLESTMVGPRGLGQLLKKHEADLFPVAIDSPPSSSRTRMRVSPINNSVGTESYLAGVSTYLTWMASSSVVILGHVGVEHGVENRRSGSRDVANIDILLYATMTEVGSTERLNVIFYPKNSSDFPYPAAAQGWLRRRSPSVARWDHSWPGKGRIPFPSSFSAADAESSCSGPKNVNDSLPIVSPIPLISPATKRSRSLGAPTCQLHESSITGVFLARRRPPSTS